MNKIKILIVDDVSTHAENAIAQLISIPSHLGLYREQRIKLALELFDIESCAMVGDALRKLKGGYIPDLAILDIDFTQLEEKDILKARLDPNIEKNKFRGLDALVELKESINILYTGNANADDEEIVRELEQRDLVYNRNWFLKGDKGNLGKVLNAQMPFILRKIAYKAFSKLANPEKEKFRALSGGFDSEKELLKYTINLQGRKFQIENFLVGWSNFAIENKHIRFEYKDAADCFDEIINSVSNYSTPTVFTGLFAKPLIQNALNEYQNSPTYYNEKQIINTQASQLILESIEQWSEVVSQSTSSLFFTIITNGYNCNVKNFSRTNLIKALIVRRLFIGLCKLRDMRVIEEIKQSEIVQCATTILKRSIDRENLKQQLFILGLSGVTQHEEQLVKYELPFVMHEEEEFLKTSLNEIISKAQVKDWTPF